jgi:hypothetical protein
MSCIDGASSSSQSDKKKGPRVAESPTRCSRTDKQPYEKPGPVVTLVDELVEIEVVLAEEFKGTGLQIVLRL